jgi:hypothetical protein
MADSEQAHPDANRGISGNQSRSPGIVRWGIASPIRYDLLIPGTYAWLVTVVSLAWSAFNGWALVCSLGAIIHLWGGVLLAWTYPVIGRTVAMIGFLGFCAATWLLLDSQLHVANLEPIRAGLGALGWLIFALSWGAVRQPGSKPEDDPRFVREAEMLVPRRALPRATLVAFAVTVMCAFAPWLAAWVVARREHALLAHAVGLGSAMWILGGGAQIAVSLGVQRTWPHPRARIAAALVPLAWACALLAVGALYRITGGGP